MIGFVAKKNPSIFKPDACGAQQWWTVHNSGAYLALGLQGQFVYVDPKSDTVVVKLSYFPPGDNDALESESISSFRAASAWNP